MSRSSWVSHLAVALFVVACGADVTVYRSASYAPRDVTVSVLGVFKNGMMDAAAWNEWAPTVVAAIGDPSCSAAFDDRMEKAAPALFSELDDSTRQDGITDEILDRAATSALGSTLLVIEVFGKAPQIKKPGSEEASSQQAPAPTPQYTGRRGGRGRRGGASPSAAPRQPARDELEVSIGVYSIRDRQVIASVQVHSDSGVAPDVLREFAGKLRETLHGAKCAGWTWQKGPDRIPD